MNTKKCAIDRYLKVEVRCKRGNGHKAQKAQNEPVQAEEIALEKLDIGQVVTSRLANSTGRLALLTWMANTDTSVYPVAVRMAA